MRGGAVWRVDAGLMRTRLPQNVGDPVLFTRCIATAPAAVAAASAAAALPSHFLQQLQ